MKWEALEEEPCSLARTIGVIGDRWTVLILRECFLRTLRFEGFQSALGITRHLLAERLKKLFRQGVLRRIPYQETPKRHEYILTQKGLDLYPVIMALVRWGDTHMVDERGRPVLHGIASAGRCLIPLSCAPSAASRCWPRKFMLIPVPARAQLRQRCRLISPRRLEHASKPLDDYG
jgi:DNA-binding HxlR family transcriptional regulator